MPNINILRIAKLGPAPCAVDLGDGSERGLYVNQDYILHKLGRPHRAINLMFCYYPLDEQWPKRASQIEMETEVTFAWDFPYDDYFPYGGGLNGSKDSEVFEYIRDVRRHGQDVILTLTMDPRLSDEHLIAIAKDLVSFGRIMLRINHEATGNWFAFTKRSTYQEIADFYVHFHKILKEYAPNVSTILCAGAIEQNGSGRIDMEDEFLEAIRTTDVWSIDQYLALHWGWPYDIAEVGGESHKLYGAKFVFDIIEKSYHRFCELNDGIRKPMVISELNADGDVTGPYDQAKVVKEFIELLKAKGRGWFSAFTMYQFRDDGRLGLEITDPNNKNVGIEQPLLHVYKEIIQDDFFSPTITTSDELSLPATLRWGGSEDSEGLAIPIHFDCNPAFCEAYFEEDLIDANFMMLLNGQWFYKAPGVKCIDFMEAFFKKPLQNECDMDLYIFAPPASGENDPTQGDDWQTNYYYTVNTLPKLRVRYHAIEE